MTNQEPGESKRTMYRAPTPARAPTEVCATTIPKNRPEGWPPQMQTQKLKKENAALLQTQRMRQPLRPHPRRVSYNAGMKGSATLNIGGRARSIVTAHPSQATRRMGHPSRSCG